MLNTWFRQVPELSQPDALEAMRSCLCCATVEDAENAALEFLKQLQAMYQQLADLSEIGTLEQLRVTPIGTAELFIAKTLPTLLMGLLAVFPSLLIARLFDVPLAGSLGLFLAYTAVFPSAPPSAARSTRRPGRCSGASSGDRERRQLLQALALALPLGAPFLPAADRGVHPRDDADEGRIRHVAEREGHAGRR